MKLPDLGFPVRPLPIPQYGFLLIQYIFCDRYHLEIDKELRIGAKVYVLYCHGMASSPKVFGMARGGRRIEKYISYKKLNKFRVQKGQPFMLKERQIWNVINVSSINLFFNSLYSKNKIRTLVRRCE